MKMGWFEAKQEFGKTWRKEGRRYRAEVGGIRNNSNTRSFARASGNRNLGNYQAWGFPRGGNGTSKIRGLS